MFAYTVRNMISKYTPYCILDTEGGACTRKARGGRGGRGGGGGKKKKKLILFWKLLLFFFCPPPPPPRPQPSPPPGSPSQGLVRGRLSRTLQHGPSLASLQALWPLALSSWFKGLS